jgi:hypothetical protein
LTIEINFFNKHNWRQYYRETNYVRLYNWTFFADDSTLYRKNDSISDYLPIITRGDTLIIDKNPYYYFFCRYFSRFLPGTWPDSIN